MGWSWENVVTGEHGNRHLLEGRSSNPSWIEDGNSADSPMDFKSFSDSCL